MKHYVLKKSGRGSRHFLCFQVKIDVQDARSGFRDSRHGCFQAEWLDSAEWTWTPDMVREIDSSRLCEIRPPKRVEWPADGDQKIVQYLVRYCRPQVWKNYALGTYAKAHESREDFVQSCQEQLLAQKREELKKFREILIHRLIELESKVLRSLDELESNPDVKAGKQAGIRNLFLRLREELSQWYLGEETFHFSLLSLIEGVELSPDFREKLLDVNQELMAKYREVHSYYETQANAVELYEVPLSYSKVDIISRGILWD